MKSMKVVLAGAALAVANLAAAKAANPAPEHKTWPIETALAARKAAKKASRAGRYASAPRRLA